MQHQGAKWMTESNADLSDESVSQIASEIEPTHRLVSVNAIAKENANDSFVLTLKSRTGSENSFVIKRYIAHGTDPGSRAQLEYEVLALLQANDVRFRNRSFWTSKAKFLARRQWSPDTFPARQCGLHRKGGAAHARWR